jgi:hypothetical protein
MKAIILVVTFALIGQLWAADELIVEKLEGAVTATEVQAFKSFMRTVPVPMDNLHNAMVYGSGGMAVESLGRMFEISGDHELLDLMLRFTDRMLAARNDPKTGVIVWTGDVMPCGRIRCRKTANRPTQAPRRVTSSATSLTRRGLFCRTTSSLSKKCQMAIRSALARRITNERCAMCATWTRRRTVSS